MDKLVIMFRNCHAMVYHNRPLTDFVWMCNLDEIKEIQLGNTYRNTEAAKNFVMAIAETEFLKVSQRVQIAKFLCFLGYGSIDASISEQEMWFLRSATGGEINVSFIGSHSTDKPNAVNISQGLENIVSDNLKCEWPSVRKKLVAFGCDGASVMVGIRGGLQLCYARISRNFYRCIAWLTAPSLL